MKMAATMMPPAEMMAVTMTATAMATAMMTTAPATAVAAAMTAIPRVIFDMVRLIIVVPLSLCCKLDGTGMNAN
jgi:hypothetical protein